MQAPSWLLSVPGASRTVLECRIPYSSSSLTQLLGHTPASYASATTAEAMAKEAYRQAAALSPFGTPILGVGATCALATDRDRLGDHRAFVSVHGGMTTRSYSLHMAKGIRPRLDEDRLASRLVVYATAAAMGAIDSLVGSVFAQQGLLGPGDAFTDPPATRLSRTELIHGMLNGKYRSLEFSGSGGFVVVDAPRPGRVYLPGSFNPLHAGHRELLSAAVSLCDGKEGAFELSIGNADKGVLPAAEIERRVAQFEAAGLPLVLTTAPLFTQKADIFPNSTFVVGYDTAERLVQERYYGSQTAMLLQFARLAHQGCNFLVAGRKDSSSGRFLTLDSLEIPDILQRGSLFRGMSEENFRMDLSSTELRAKGQGL